MCGLALFPFTVQYANTAGESHAWEIWSCVIMSGRHKTEGIGGGVQLLFRLIRPWRCKQQTVLIVYLANVLTFSIWTDSTRKGIEILRWALPPMSLSLVPSPTLVLQATESWAWDWERGYMSLPSVYLMPAHVTRSPRPSPTAFAYSNRSNSGSGNGLGTRLHFLIFHHRNWRGRKIM